MGAGDGRGNRRTAFQAARPSTSTARPENPAESKSNTHCSGSSQALSTVICLRRPSIPPESRILSPPHRRVPKPFAEFLFGHARKRFQLRRECARLKSRVIRNRRFTSPWANVLADVAPKHVRADTCLLSFTERPALLDRPVRNATPGIEGVASGAIRDQCSSRACIDTPRAGAATIRWRSVGLQIERK
jgi:hypothetical protein